ncbi:Gfo/Idh/MocA family protein [Prochlorococcus marinus]|uniref:Oxidoreductase n=1 Tax=Prochlorococcus marinus XMU1408 TaxID=2213228 RepID=A0A318RAI4_PROMR|nr:Gfo/Idh/MocA family oxidoreductase [Prochlorococcus marinus]MBW3041786.1 oxidoreductase [Prochlorococcus marinus str. XMU1408]PYE02929.1 oxidoreductase [Prochlorococcus marinus XMU1408]
MINKYKRIRIAIAGLGFGESVHIPASLSNENIELVGLWHPRQDRLEEACKKHNLCAYETWNGLVNDPKIEGIIIATPPAPRFELAIQAIQAGKHLLLEKPTCLNAYEVMELQRNALKKNLQIAVDYEYRAVPLFMQAKRIIDEKKLEEPYFLKLDWLMSSRANPDRPWNWYSDENSGGGVLGALGTHAFDMIHWLIGPTYSLSSINSTSIKERFCPLSKTTKRVTSEDVSISQLQIKSIHNNLIPCQINLSAVTKQSKGFNLEIYGKNGTLILSSDNQKDYVHGFGLWFSHKGEVLKNIQPDSDLAFSKIWTDGRIAPVARIQNWWAQSIKDGTPVIPGLVEGLASQKVCDKVKESNLNGIKIEID